MVQIQTATYWPSPDLDNKFLVLHHSPYLAHTHLGLLLAAVLAVWLQRGEAELPEQVTGAAQQVAGKAQIPAGF